LKFENEDSIYPTKKKLGFKGLEQMTTGFDVIGTDADDALWEW